MDTVIPHPSTGARRPAPEPQALGVLLIDLHSAGADQRTLARFACQQLGVAPESRSDEEGLGQALTDAILSGCQPAVIGRFTAKRLKQRVERGGLDEPPKATPAPTRNYKPIKLKTHDGITTSVSIDVDLLNDFIAKLGRPALKIVLQHCNGPTQPGLSRSFMVKRLMRALVTANETTTAVSPLRLV